MFVCKDELIDGQPELALRVCGYGGSERLDALEERPRLDNTEPLGTTDLEEAVGLVEPEAELTLRTLVQEVLARAEEETLADERAVLTRAERLEGGASRLP